jgi:ABC-type transport system involved in multi-copper enzyme maturation permease subunit
MTAETLGPAPSRAPDEDRRPPGAEFVRGIATVARLELRQRVRSSRWVAVLVVWVALLGLLTVLIRWSVRRAYSTGDAVATADAQATAGRLVFGIVVFLVLSLGALVVPALSATSINGDRAAGVLATLQTTLLTPVQIVIGKLLASWTVALALLAGAAPFLVWSFVEGEAPFGRLLVVIGVLALTLLVVCSIGLGWSAVAARTSSSALLTYLTVAFLGVGLPLLFLLSLPLVTTTEQVTVRNLQPVDATASESSMECVTSRDTLPRTHTERSWWLLAPSPYVVIADAAPRPAGVDLAEDPLSGIRTGVREARLGPPAAEDYCDFGGNDAAYQARERARAAERERLGATWPVGLASNVALSGVFLTVAIRRLRAPARRLPRGTRVA